jgi:choice-of-anchor A domain-containing protein
MLSEVGGWLGSGVKRINRAHCALLSAAAALIALLSPTAHAAGIGTNISACVGTGCPATYTAITTCASFTGRDNAYAIYTGGDYIITDGAEAEGRAYVTGNLVMNKSGTFNIVEVGVGACVVPVNSNATGGLPHVVVGGNLQRNAGNLLVGQPGLVSDVLVAGAASGAGTVTTSGVVTAGATVPAAPESFTNLQTKSTYWNTLPTTGTGAGSSTYTFTGDGTSALQVFNVTVSGSGAPPWPSFAEITFANIPANATILINVTGASSMNIATANFVDQSGGGGFSFNTDLTRRILWNFPSATSVTFSGFPQWQGSVLAPAANVTMSVPGFNGRMIVGGNLTQNCSGCEFHNYDFKGDLPAPPSSSCSLTFGTITPTTCSAATNTYGVTVNVSYTNAPAGETIGVGVTGATNQTITQPGTTATFTGLTADGASKTVTAAFSGGTCSATNASFTAPASCAPSTTTVSGRVYREGSAPANTTDNGNTTDPGIGSVAIALACTSPSFTASTSTSATDGSYSFTNVPIGATCAITETQPAGYSNVYITPGATTGSPSNPAEAAGSTSNSVINIIVPATGSPMNNFAEQLIPAACSLTFGTITPTVCSAATNTYGVTVNVSYANAPAGETISVGITGATNQTITQPDTIATFTGLTADGTSKTVTAAFSGGTCSATNASFTAPASCAPTTTTVSGRVYREASSPANTTDNGNATDPGLVTQVALSCAPAYTGTTPISTASDGLYSFANVPIGATCTITETQPAGYTNAYNTLGTGASAETGGTAGSAANGTITLTVPAAGSPGNNFAQQSADTVSTTSCTPSGSVAPNTAVSCTVTCTNNGPGNAVGMSCAVTNAASLPGSPTPSCSPSANVAVNGTLSCTVGFTTPASGSVTVNGGSAASNDTNGGSVAANGNNPSSTSIDVSPVPTTSVSGRVYVEASAPANTADNGNTVDRGLVTQVALACAPAYTGTTPIATAADGTYTFTNVPAGATCTISETQPTGYTNAYNTPGTGGTGNTGGVAGSSGNSTITLVVPTAGSPGNNFAEQSADMVSTTVCSVVNGPTGPQASCVVTCTNNGPGAAVNATCAITNLAALPGSALATCAPTSASLAVNGTLTCNVSFPLAANDNFTVVGGAGSSNDTNGGTLPGSGNNPSTASVGQPAVAVPTLGLGALLLLLLSVAVLSRQNLRSTRSTS